MATPGGKARRWERMLLHCTRHVAASGHMATKRARNTCYSILLEAWQRHLARLERQTKTPLHSQRGIDLGNEQEV
eukprot:3843463-Pyramimonas_sp.AAC.1